MALYQFTSTPNTGALRTTKVSRQIYKAAIAECVFMAHVSPEPFGTGMGQSVTIPGEANPTELSDYSLSETDRVPEGSHTVDAKVVTVGEFGHALTWSRLADDLSVFDLRSSIQRSLKKEMKLFLDGRACRAFKLTNLKYTPTGAASSSTATNGTAPTAALANMNVYHVAAIRDLLFDTYKAPMVDGSYMGIFRTLGIRGIKNDPDWEEWQKYTSPEAKFNSEAGKIEQVRLVECNHGGTTVGSVGLNTGLGTGSVLGEGLIFGDDAVVMIESAEPQIIPGQPDDFGRIKSLAWYCQLEMSLKTDSVSAGRPRVMHITST
jgi:N4-gp56 family major capsid protein